MSTLNLGGSPILKSMESGTAIWENAAIKFTANWYKKDNVVTMNLGYTLKQNIGHNQTSGVITGNLPSKCYPVADLTFPTLDGEYPCSLFLNTSGQAELTSYSNMLANYSASQTITYLVND